MARINKAELLTEFEHRFEEALVTFEVNEDKTEVEFVIKIDKDVLDKVQERRGNEYVMLLSEPVSGPVPSGEPVGPIARSTKESIEDEELMNRIEAKGDELISSGLINNYDFGVKDETVELEFIKGDEGYYETLTFKEFEEKYLTPIAGS